MDPLHAFALALIQGITEFLPISSSAHLVLPGKLLGWPDQGLAFDTAVHLGSLVAVIVYFRQELQKLTIALFKQVANGQSSADSQFAINLIIASLPIIPVGFVFRFMIETSMRTIEVIAFTTVFFGIALLIADRLRSNEAQTLTTRGALMIGFAQCLALIPGTSRSGVTITMALLVGHSREDAARISFLLSIPAIAGAAAIKCWDLVRAPLAVDWTLLAMAALVAGLSAYFCIRLLLSFISQLGYMPFVIYRIALGGLLAWMIV